MNNIDKIWNIVDDFSDRFIKLSDSVWNVPELNFAEFESCALHYETLEREGFNVTKNIAGMPTALVAEAGNGGPIIAFLGEYDALPGLSQEAGVIVHTPISGVANGHACGHNLLGSGSLLAATAVKKWLTETNTPGRVRYYGCPAEEGGAGKTFMVREGIFHDVDIAISWHPSCFAGVSPPASLANLRVEFTFSGRSSHASASPHLGRSALDASELMNVGVNYLREHIPVSSRIHYAYIDAGGIAPNIVQARVTTLYSIRTPETGSLLDLFERVKQIAKGAAMMTGTSVDINIISTMADLLPCRPLELVMQSCLERLGPPIFDDLDRDLASSFQTTFSQEDIDAVFDFAGIKKYSHTPLCSEVLPFNPAHHVAAGSTDVGDVSWVVPTVQALGATCAIGTQLHSWQMTSQGKSSFAHKGMVHAAKVMASTATDVYTNGNLLKTIKEFHASQLIERSYVCPLPDYVVPPVSK